MRIGFGYDLHRLVADRQFILAGVVVPFERGFAAHSDGDVLIHAVCDALLGAANLGDIGQHFSDKDAKFKDRDSRELLREVARMLTLAGWKVGNIDSTIIAQTPKLAPYINEMRHNLAADLVVDLNCVSIKAKTNEHIGCLGRGEGVAVHAVALIEAKLT